MLLLPLLLIVLALAPIPASAEDYWTCRQDDGTTIFSNHTKAPKDRGPVAGKTELGILQRTPEPGPPKAAEPQPATPAIPAMGQPIINIIVNAPPVPAPLQPAENLAPAGEISFETARMLAVGMTEAEILGRAGIPRATSIGGGYTVGAPYPVWPMFGASRFVYSNGDWLVELTFGGGRVISINHSRVQQ